MLVAQALASTSYANCFFFSQVLAAAADTAAAAAGTAAEGMPRLAHLFYSLCLVSVQIHMHAAIPCAACRM